MASIQVNSAGMRDKAASFRNIAESIRGYSEEMKRIVDGLHTTWEGTASEETRGVYTQFQQSFDEKYNTILAYAKFIENAADAYDQTENANAQN